MRRGIASSCTYYPYQRTHPPMLNSYIPQDLHDTQEEEKNKWGCSLYFAVIQATTWAFWLCVREVRLFLIFTINTTSLTCPAVFVATASFLHTFKSKPSHQYRPRSFVKTTTTPPAPPPQPMHLLPLWYHNFTSPPLRTIARHL